MSVLRLLLREIQHRALSFALAVSAVVAATALTVGVLTMCEAYDRETTRLLRNMGFNVLVLPEGADVGQFWSDDFTTREMPEEYVQRLAASRAVTIQHLVARLQRKIAWRGRQALLTGVLPEVPMGHAPAKSPMGPRVSPGTVQVGYQVARALGLHEGDQVRLLGRSFTVSRCLGEQGGKDDIRVLGDLHEVQQLLGRRGRISDIEALSCQCAGQRLVRIREELARVLPGTQVTEFRPIAEARDESREMVQRVAGVLIPAVALAAALWVGLLAFGNVRERRSEIGVLRALGLSGGRVASLFLGRALLVGLVGAALGFALGTGLALHLGPQLFPLTANKIVPLLSLLPWALGGAALVCAAASYVPTMLGLSQDPAAVLAAE